MSYLHTFNSALKNKKFLVLDTETTGLYADAEICQIAIINSQGEILLDSLVKPKNPIPVDATRIHGITNEMVKDVPIWLDLIPTVNDILKGQTVVIYNVDYDTRIMNQSNWIHDVNNIQWRNVVSAWWCAQEAYAEHYGETHHYYETYIWQKLSFAAQEEGVTVANAHNALGDCLMTLGVVQALLKAADNG